MKKRLLILTLCSNLTLLLGQTTEPAAQTVLEGAKAESLPVNSEFQTTGTEALEGRMVPAWGQYSVCESLTFGVGRGQMRDTYLTNLLYEGTSLDIQYARTRLTERFWTRSQEVDLSFTSGEDSEAGLSSMMAGRIRYRYGLTRSWRVWRKQFLSIGPYMGLDAGFNYNQKLANGNNPATARIAGNAGILLSTGWQYHICRQSCGVGLSLYAPMLGAAFVPEYGASYYETFYLDHTKRDVHFTSLHNQQDLDVRLTTSVPLALVPCWRKYSTRLHVGIGYHIETMDINDIVTRYSNLQLSIGWSWKYNPLYHHQRTFYLEQ